MQSELAVIETLSYAITLAGDPMFTGPMQANKAGWGQLITATEKVGDIDLSLLPDECIFWNNQIVAVQESVKKERTTLWKVQRTKVLPLCYAKFEESGSFTASFGGFPVNAFDK